MIDYIIIQHEKWLTVLAVLVLVTIVELVADRSRARSGWANRFFNLGAGSVLLVFGGYMGFQLTVALDRLNIFPAATLSTLSYVTLFVLMQDLIYYFYHRLQHSWPWLWGIHKLHHTDSDVNITTSHRTHVLEKPLQTLLISVPVVLFLGYHQEGFFLVTFFNLFFLYFGHVRLNVNLGPLGYVFVGPRFHRVHHSIGPEHSNRNFAQFFSFFDLMFGTYAPPESIKSVRTGVLECATHRDQWLPMIWPFGAFRTTQRELVS